MAETYGAMLVWKKATKNKDVYEDGNESSPVGTLYVDKKFTRGAKSINIVIERNE